MCVSREDDVSFRFRTGSDVVFYPPTKKKERSGEEPVEHDLVREEASTHLALVLLLLERHEDLERPVGRAKGGGGDGESNSSSSR